MQIYIKQIGVVKRLRLMMFIVTTYNILLEFARHNTYVYNSMITYASAKLDISLYVVYKTLEVIQTIDIT